MTSLCIALLCSFAAAGECFVGTYGFNRAIFANGQIAPVLRTTPRSHFAPNPIALLREPQPLRTAYTSGRSELCLRTRMSLSPVAIGAKLCSKPDLLFQSIFVVLSAVAVASKVLDRKTGTATDGSVEAPAGPEVRSLQARFLVVFWLLRMADWLQGPYFYEVYASKIIQVRCLIPARHLDHGAPLLRRCCYLAGRHAKSAAHPKRTLLPVACGLASTPQAAPEGVRASGCARGGGGAACSTRGGHSGPD